MRHSSIEASMALTARWPQWSVHCLLPALALLNRTFVCGSFALTRVQLALGSASAPPRLLCSVAVAVSGSSSSAESSCSGLNLFLHRPGVALVFWCCGRTC